MNFISFLGYEFLRFLMSFLEVLVIFFYYKKNYISFDYKNFFKILFYFLIMIRFDKIVYFFLIFILLLIFK